MKIMIIALAFSLLLVMNAFALQQIAGALNMPVPLGGSNTSRYGLMNDGNETVTINLTADGDAAKYLSFPATVSLQPNELVYTNITAALPSNYNTSLGMNITGSLYALEQGSPGQVQINIQMKKSVTIMAYKGEVSPITAFILLIVKYSPAIILLIALFVIVFAMYRIRKKKKVKSRGGEMNE